MINEASLEVGVKEAVGPRHLAIVHITMLVLAGFWRNVRAMITGYMPDGEKVR